MTIEELLAAQAGQPLPDPRFAMPQMPGAGAAFVPEVAAELPPASGGIAPFLRELGLSFGASPFHANVQMGQQGAGAGTALALLSLLGNFGVNRQLTRESERGDINERERAKAAERNKANLEISRENRLRESGRMERLQKMREAAAERATIRGEQKAADDEERIYTLPASLLRRLGVPEMAGEKFTRKERDEFIRSGKPERGPSGGEPLVIVEGPNGPTYVPRSQAAGRTPGKSAPKPKLATGADRQSLAYYNRAKEAVDTMAMKDKSGRSLEERVGLNVASQTGLRYAPNVLKSGDQQAYRQAQRAFTEARLRKESGAAIPPAEYENDAKTYFAQPGDKPAVIEQKRLARTTVLEGLKFSAGKAYDEFYGGGEAGAEDPPTHYYDPATGEAIEVDR